MQERPKSEKRKEMSKGSTAASAPPMELDVRNVMRYFASAVTVVTSALPSGELFGLTISAFISVSLKPPYVLISVRNESTAKNLFVKSKKYCVNILSADQQGIAERFSLLGEAGRFVNLDFYTGKGGSPIIRNCIGYLDCKILRTLKIGDHTLFLGEVIDLAAVKKKPLLYLNRNYARLDY